MVVTDFNGLSIFTNSSNSSDSGPGVPRTLQPLGAPCDACQSLTQAKYNEHYLTPNKFYGSSLTFDYDYRTRALRTKINYLHDPFVHRVPVEIASQIFIAYVQDAWSPAIPPPTTTATTIAAAGESDISHSTDLDLEIPVNWFAPLLLASVCHTWRSIALSTPHLWTSVYIHLAPSSNIPLCTSLTTQWLHRTGASLPLSITLVLPDPYPLSYSSSFSPSFSSSSASSTSAALLPLISLLRSFSPRWKHLTLRSATYYYQPLTHSLHSLPLLHSLHLSLSPDPSIWTTSLPPSSFRVRTPSLRILKLSSISLARVPLKTSLLHSFEASDVFIADILSLLRTAQSLVHCKFTRISGSTGIFPLSTPTSTSTTDLITHPTLHSLSLQPEGSITSPLSTLLLSRLVLPSLTHLECDYSCTRDALPDEALLGLVARSRCDLRWFGVRVVEKNTRMTDGCLIRILEGLPSLTHLEVSTRFLTPLFSDVLLGRLGGGLDSDLENGILPDLESLEFSGGRTFSWASFIQFLQSNLVESGSGGSTNVRSCRPLKRIKIKLARRLADPFELMNNDVRKLLLDAIGSTGITVEIVGMAGESLL